MTAKVRALMAIDGIPRTKLMMIPVTMTIKEVLNLVNSREKRKDLIHVWLDGSELDEDEIFSDFWQDGVLFFCSASDIPPTDEQIDTLLATTVRRAPLQVSSLTTPSSSAVPSRPPSPGSSQSSGSPRIYQIPPPEPAVKPALTSFQVFTSMTFDSLMNGRKLDIPLSANLDVILTAIAPYLREVGPCPASSRMLVFLPGGVQLTRGTIEDYVQLLGQTWKRHLYVVVIHEMKDSLLTATYTELANATEARRPLLSPFVESTDVGYSNIASLLGYLQHASESCTKLAKALALTTRFAPLVNALHRLARNGVISGTDIVSVTAPLRAVIQGFVTVSEREVFQHVLQVASYVVGKLDGELESIPVATLTPRAPGADSLNQYLAGHLSADEVEFWQPDQGVAFTNHFLEQPSDRNVILTVFDQFTLFKPAPLLSLRREVGAKIFWSGGGRTSLCLPQIDDLSDSVSHKLTFVDPLRGDRQSKDVEEVGVHIEDSDPSGTVAVVDPNEIHELVIVCFDESSSMEWDLDGSRILAGDGTRFPRVTVAAQYLTSLANRQFALNIQRVQGLFTFGSTVTIRARLNPLSPRFEDGIKKVTPAGRTMLWDCLLRARDALLTAKPQYPNAALRIIVISDGEDTQSSSLPHIVAKQLIDSSIVVDAIIVNLRESSKPLCTLSHLTGGYAFRPDSIEEGLQLFEQEGFLSLSQRPPIVRFVGSITSESFEAKVGAVQFDKVVPNVERDETRTIGQISTARYGVYFLRDVQPTQSRFARLRTELKFAAIVQDRNATVVNSNRQRISVHDPGLRIYPMNGKIDCWRVFLQGPVGTPYANKWWYLTVTFPSNYPEHPPKLRFVSVPFHINISSEGQICLPFLTREYQQSARAVELIQQVREVFLIPNEESPVQLAVFDLYRQNRVQYRQKAAQSCRNAKNSPEEWIAGLRVTDSVPSDFSMGELSYAPQWERSVFTGEPIPKADQVISSTGVIYHREELRRYIAATPNPICPITGRRLVEAVASLGGL